VFRAKHIHNNRAKNPHRRELGDARAEGAHGEGAVSVGVGRMRGVDYASAARKQNHREQEP
jgi:hypothetical protein